MGYVMGMAPCISCKQTFSFNPVKVPSVRVNGVKEPVCERCFDRLNEVRKEAGMEPWQRHADAYEPADEHEL